MKSWQLAVVVPALLTVAGCRVDPNIVLLERENRTLEDEVYRLREKIEDYETMLQSSPDAELSPKSARSDTSGPGPLFRAILPEGVPDPAEATGSSGDAAPASDAGTAPPWSPPVPESIPSDPEPEAPSTPDPSKSIDQGLLELIPPGLETRQRRVESGRVGPGPSTTPADSRQVTRLELDARRTGGYNADSRPGDEGIVAVLEPRDAQGRSVAAPAEVAVVVLDPALSGEAARVARWDFTAEEIATQLGRTRTERGISLQLTWPAAVPEHENLHLFVRYVTADGRKLQTDRPIRIDLSGKSSYGWTPATGPANPPLDLPAVASQPTATQAVPAPVKPATHIAARPAADPPRPEQPVWSPNRW